MHLIMFRSLLPRCVLLVALFLLPTVFLGPMPSYAGDHDPWRIVVLQSYHADFSWTEDIMKGIHHVFGESGQNAEFYVEYMDTKRLPKMLDTELLSSLQQLLTEKYRSLQPNLIITVDDDAFRFLLNRHKTMFPQVPIVFCGVNNPIDEGEIAAQKVITGVTEILDRKETIDTALVLHPGTKKLAVITDTTTNGIGNRHILKELATHYTGRVQFVFLDEDGTGMTLEELRNALSRLDDETIAYYGDFFRDRNGFLDQATVMPALSKESRRPIYSPYSFIFGLGTVGGKLNSPFFQGEAAAQIAIQILTGTPPSQIPIIKGSINPFMFDFRQMERWGIPAERLPAGSIVMYKPISFFQEYRRLTIGIVIVFSILISVIAALIFSVHRRKQAEGTLRESEQNFRNLANSGRALIWAAGTDKLCNYFNRNWLEFTGRTLQQEWGNGWAEGVHSEDLQRCLDIYVGAFDRRENFSMEYRLRRHDGEFRWVIDDGCPRFDSSGKFIGYVGHCLDITERRQAEEALRDSQERLNAIFSATPDPIVVYDGEGHPQYLNSAFTDVFGWALDELKGRQIPFVPADQKELTARKINETYEFRKTVKIQTKRLTKAGVQLDVIASAAVIQGEEDNPAGLVVNITDISEYKKLEALLQQAQKLESIGTLAGGIAHDFNNILSPLLGFAELLKEDIPVESPLQEHIDEIIRAGLRSKELVQQILAFSRKGDRNTKPIKLPPIIKEALILLRSSIPTTIDIQQGIDPDCGVVFADPTQIHQIVMNLATNAYHSMEDTGGKLVVSLEEIRLTSASGRLDCQPLLPGNYAHLMVSDTGTGIEKAILDKIFDPYFTTKGVGKGTGLGLSVVQGIVKAHKGEIVIDSQPGKGTAVHVFLPILERTVDNNQYEGREPIPGGKENILLVDDEPSIVRMEQQALEKLGYHVTAHHGSLEALGAFKVNPAAFDLVLTDMTMPMMTGDQLAEKLISIRSDIPIILCTGYSEKISAEKIKDMGIKGLLMKPVVKWDMAQMVRKVLDAGSSPA